MRQQGAPNNAPTTRKATWNDCKNGIQNHTLTKDTFSFVREQKNIDAYNVHKENVAITYETMGDFILHTYFKLKPTKNEKTHKLKIVITDEIAQTDHYVFLPNNFPYYLEDNISHDLLFSIKPLNKHQIETIIQKELGNDSEYLWWINPENLKSINNVWHCHIVSKRHQSNNSLMPVSSKM